MEQRAIAMCLVDIGENLARMRKADLVRFENLAPDSWYRLIGLRNLIAHGYVEIRFDEIWHILTFDWPPFIESLEVIRTSGKPPSQ